MRRKIEAKQHTVYKSIAYDQSKSLVDDVVHINNNIRNRLF